MSHWSTIISNSISKWRWGASDRGGPIQIHRFFSSLTRVSTKYTAWSQWWIGFIVVYCHTKVAISPSSRPGVSAPWQASWKVSANEVFLQTPSLLTFRRLWGSLPLLVSMIHFMDSHVKNAADSASHNCTVRDQGNSSRCCRFHSPCRRVVNDPSVFVH